MIKYSQNLLKAGEMASMHALHRSFIPLYLPSTTSYSPKTKEVKEKKRNSLLKQGL